MNENATLIDLGFAEAHLPPGTHICQIYSEANERDDSLLRYLLKGVQNRESNACFSENISESTLKDYFFDNGIDLEKVKEAGAFGLYKTSDIYFKDGCFNPDAMIELLIKFHTDSEKCGFSGARVIGEMTTEINEVPGGERLLEYESRVSLLLKEHPVTAVCQYNANHFSGADIMDVLKVHPMMVVDGAVIHNPFYIAPEIYLKKLQK